VAALIRPARDRDARAPYLAICRPSIDRAGGSRDDTVLAALGWRFQQSV